MLVCDCAGAPGCVCRSWKDGVADGGVDCGMTHFHDDYIRAVFLENAPDKKDEIDKMKFGEILE